MKSSSRQPSIAIMGIRGVPAQHGGFETFAARLAPYLALRGWRVTVYCQEDERGPTTTSDWQGVRRVHIGVGPDTAANSIRFDWACVRHALKERPPLVLTLGYNTAVFGVALRAAGIRHVINMDGIEWSRSKWGPMARAWLYLNDWAGCLGAHHLLADHPEIARHLHKRVAPHKVTMIPYGTDLADAAAAAADAALLAPLGLSPRDAAPQGAGGGYVTLIARPEPENSVLEIVRAFSARRRGVRLVVLGNYVPERLPYHAQVLAEASDEVQFAGAIYDPAVVGALRRHCLLYVHGHRVGGTNPSLLEAMGAGNAVLAHDNRFNRWVVGTGSDSGQGHGQAGAWYFKDTAGCRDALDALLADPAERARLAGANRRRAAEAFGWPAVLQQYETMLAAQLALAVPSPLAAPVSAATPERSRAPGGPIDTRMKP